MKYFTVSLVLFLNSFVLSDLVTAASFDCSGDTLTLVEKAICTDRQLSRFDDQLADLYHKAMAKTTDKAVLKKSQQDWIRERNQCRDLPCLREVYTKRMEDLSVLSVQRSAGNLCSRDWNNFEYYDESHSLIRVKADEDGIPDDEDDKNIPCFNFTPICGDLTGDGEEEIIIMWWCNDGANRADQGGIILTLEKGKLRKLADFPYFEREEAPSPENVRIEKRILKIRKPVLMDDDALCCPSGVEDIHFRLNGKKMVKITK